MQVYYRFNIENSYFLTKKEILSNFRPHKERFVRKEKFRLWGIIIDDNRGLNFANEERESLILFQVVFRWLFPQIGRIFFVF